MVATLSVGSALAFSARAQDVEGSAGPPALSDPLADGGFVGVGLGAFASFEQLPVLKTGVRAASVSSRSNSDAATVSDGYDPNDDYSNYLEQTSDSRVLFDVVGSGAIYRFWHTDDAMDAWAPGDSQPGGSDIVYDFYFDDEAVPRLSLHGPKLWSGALRGFESPLVLDADASSGGAVSYRPITFAKRLRILASGDDYPAHDYYSIDYHRYPDSAAVVSYRDSEDARPARAVLERAGQSPLPASDDSIEERVTADLPSGATVELARWSGPAMLTELRFEVPDMRREEFPVSADDGRSTLHSVEFELSIAPENTAVKLVRRLVDSSPQSGDVYIDAEYAGRWSTPGRGDPFVPTRAATAWLESAFELPAALTAGKRRVHVRIAAVAPAESADVAEWNEFHYWARSTLGGADTVTDALDVGDPVSEAAHAYAIVEPVWSGTGTYRPIEPQVVEGDNDGRALAGVRLQMFWDDATTPQVDVPFSEFFGTGAGYVAEVQALPVGHSQGRFYCYFPMPFARSARIVLINPAGNAALRGLSLSTRRRPFPIDFAHVGQFNAVRHAVDATTVGRDYEILTARGQGHFVGTNLLLPDVTWTLEGDEHIYVDDMRSPALAGTGTEDYVNGGWYFSRGPFSAPFSGSPERGAYWHPISIYRFHITDYIPFRTGIRVAIEHDGINSNQVPYASVAYYYANAQAGMVEVDAFEPADAAGAAAHAYAAEGDVSTPTLSATFFADAVATAGMETRTGSESSESASFEVKIDPANAGVVLRRLYDRATPNQRAEVYVDEVFVGTWYSAGSDETHRWHEDEFWIPAQSTRARDRLQVRLLIHSTRWSAYRYQAYALRPVGA